jgi:hypothetical protein
MVAIDRLKNAINNSSELSERGENRKALTLLDDEIANAVGENKSIWVRTLSRHASAIADQMGDLDLVRQYREQCLTHDPDNPLTLLSVAEVLDRVCNTDRLSAAHPRIIMLHHPKGDDSVESHPFGFAQGRLLRTERARMGHLGYEFVRQGSKTNSKSKSKAADRSVRSTRAAALAKLP